MSNPSAPAREAASVQPIGEAGAPQCFAGRYEILGLLGAGGMGSVYRARDVELDEIVALKILRREIADLPGILERFRKEVKLARRVTHINVARTFDVGEHDGDTFLTMECIDGESLRAALSRTGPMSPRRAIAIASALCEGLATAHAAGVIHRDLKPDNVLLDRSGRTVITDFGVAHLRSDDTTQTGGHFLGTPAYMAPEQLLGEGDLDARVDVYALGAITYEMLVDRRAWSGRGALGTAMARLKQPPPDPRDRRPDVPAALAEVVLRCMARRREDRFASALEVREALTLSSAGAPGSLAPPAPRAPSLRLSSSPPSRVIQPKTLAVLPLRNAGAPEDDYLADGFTEDLTDTLSMTPGLRVRPRGVVARLGGDAADPRELGRALGVQVIVEGSLRRAAAGRADGVRVHARAISVEDGFQLWAGRFDASAEGLLGVSDDAARAIVDALTIDRAPPPRDAPSDPRAVDLYLRARHQLRRLWYGDAAPAVALFEQALERAPLDPTLLAGYAMACARLASVKGQGGEKLARAKDAAERAIAAAPNHGEPWAALAVVRFCACDPAGAIGPLRAALNLAPSLAKAHEMLGRILMEAGLVDEASFRLETALSLDPSELLPRWELARGRALIGEWAAAAALLELPPEDAASRYHRALMRARIGLWRRRPFPPDDEPLVADVTPVRFTRVLRDVHETGRLEEEHARWLRAIAEEAEVGSRLRPLFFQHHAEILGFLGETAQAVDAVAGAVEAGLFDALWMARCPLLDDARADPRFAALRARVDKRAAEVVATLSA